MTFIEFENLRQKKWKMIQHLAREIPNANFLSIAERNAKKILDILAEIEKAKHSLPEMEV